MRSLRPPRRLLSSEDDIEVEEEEEVNIDTEDEGLSEQELPSRELAAERNGDNDGKLDAFKTKALPRRTSSSSPYYSTTQATHPRLFEGFLASATSAARSAHAHPAQLPVHPPLMSSPPHVSSTAFGRSAASVISAASNVTSVASKKGLHEEISRLHQVLGLQAQELEMVHESLRAKDDTLRRAQGQSDDLLQEARQARVDLKRCRKSKLETEEALEEAQKRVLVLQEKVKVLEMAVRRTGEVGNSSPGSPQGPLEEAGSVARTKARAEAKAREAAELVDGMRARLDDGMEQLRECLATIETLETSLHRSEREKIQAQEEVRRLTFSLSSQDAGGGEVTAWKARATAAEARAKAMEGELSVLRERESSQTPAAARTIMELEARCQNLEEVLRKSKEVDREALEAAQRATARLESEREAWRGKEMRRRQEVTDAKSQAETYRRKALKLEDMLESRRAEEEGGGKRRGGARGHDQAKAAEGVARAAERALRSQQEELKARQTEAADLRSKCRDYLQAMNGVMDDLERMKAQQEEEQQRTKSRKESLDKERRKKSREALSKAQARCLAFEKESLEARRIVKAEQEKARELEMAVSEAAARIVAYEEEMAGTRTEMSRTVHQLEELQAVLRQQEEQAGQNGEQGESRPRGQPGRSPQPMASKAPQRQEEEALPTSAHASTFHLHPHNGLGEMSQKIIPRKPSQGPPEIREDRLTEVLMRTTQQVQRATRSTHTVFPATSDGTTAVSPSTVVASHVPPIGPPAFAASSASSALAAFQRLRDQLRRSHRDHGLPIPVSEHQEQEGGIPFSSLFPSSAGREEERTQEHGEHRADKQDAGGKVGARGLQAALGDEESEGEEGNERVLPESLEQILQRCRSLKADLLTAVDCEEEREPSLGETPQKKREVSKTAKRTKRKVPRKETA